MTDPMTLKLGERRGLPDEIALLRAAFPKDTWRAHANFGQLADFWLHVHASLRHEGAEVSRIVDAFRARQIDTARFQQGFVTGLNHFLQHLDQHHRIEDHAYFPKFRQLDERLVVGFDLLEGDHALIHERLVATVEQARALLQALPGPDAAHAIDGYAVQMQRFIDLLLAHLADEEDLVIPAILQHGERALG
ncbi:hemerythrin domain-containing protein [uncultured Sphingomonas sp.]|uniref:hemerythrin domain-containing protein n=1 Tax=uncultured Sphingomonas sp. TaxID=158754 RepID=UPI0025DED504|nr:hemerythrin domain-containing protein [uncultured Sphingomonas sp.]